MTQDLKLLNESKLVLQRDQDGFIQCSPMPQDHPNGFIIDIFQTGDIKWLAMLLGMEGHSGCWCIHCLLSPSEWKPENHTAGTPRTVELINQTVVTHNIDEHTESNPRYRGVSSRPVFDFLLVSSFVLPLLHIRIGIFNDIDNWFQGAVDKIVVKTEEERQILRSIHDCHTMYEAARSQLQQFIASDAGKERDRLNRRKNRTQNEEVRLTELQVVRDQIARERDSWRTKETAAKGSLKSYQTKQKGNNSSFYYAINEYWGSQGKHKESYHGGAWNGNHAKDVLRDPDRFYGGMRDVLLEFKEGSIPNETVDTLLSSIVELLKAWNDVFRLFGSKTRTQQNQTDLAAAITKAVKLHRELGLSVTPKVHLIEDHALHQFINMPYPLYYLIEEFVEQNHQKGHNVEEQPGFGSAEKSQPSARTCQEGSKRSVQKSKAVTGPTPRPSHRQSIPVTNSEQAPRPEREDAQDSVVMARHDSMCRADSSGDAAGAGDLQDDPTTNRRLEGTFDRLG
eukprot:scaffold12009_cov61-Cyclotella_meneghiniana.AAC.4